MQLAINERKAEIPIYIGVGEIGIDLYWDKTYWAEQQEALKIQLELAKKFELPFVIHCRESIDETIELIEPLNNEKLQGVFHCFTGSLDQAEKIAQGCPIVASTRVYEVRK